MSAAEEVARGDPADATEAAARRDLVLEAASVQYLSGVNTSSVIASAEQLADRLGVPGRLSAHWGALQFVTDRHEVYLVPARPEAVNMAAAEAAGGSESDFFAGRIGQEELRARIADAARTPGPRTVPFAVAAGVGAVALALLWGLSEPGGLVLVGLAAAAGGVLRRRLIRRGVGLGWQVFAAALIGGLVGAAAARLTTWSPGELVALGPALVLVPGPQLLNGGLDVSGGRISLGIARLVSAMITILAISAGVLLGLSVIGRSVPVVGAPVVLPPGLDVVLAAIAAGAYTVFFNMPWRFLAIPMVVGGLAHLLHSLLVTAGWNLPLASGVGALFAGIVCIPVAARLQVPFAGIGFASVVSMVPSIYVHRSVSGLLELVGRRGGADLTLLDGIAYDVATAVLVILALVVGTVIPLRLHRAIRGRRS